MNRSTLAIVLAASVLGSGCANAPLDAHDREVLTGKLVITGSSTVAPVVAELALAFEKEHSDVRIDVQSGGSSRGIADVRTGVADIGMASRALVESEEDLNAFPIARDGVTLIVNADNPVEALTDAQIRDIFVGRVTDWSEIRGAPGDITVVHKAAGRATRQVFLRYFDLAEGSVDADVVVGENEQGVKTVEGNTGAIGYVSIGTALADIEAGVGIRLLTVGGVDPKPRHVASGDFPLSRPLLLLTGVFPNPLARSFIDFARSEQAAPIIRAQHFIPSTR